MVKTGAKKKNIRVRRRVRKTLGVACLITALLVAAIPVPEVSADEGDEDVLTWDKDIYAKNKSVIPVVPKTCNTIYTTGDGTYQFAWVNASDGSTNRIAVILGYDARNLQNNYLEIPDEVDAFTQFNENEGARTGYVAVSRSQKPLYYLSATNEVVDETDEEGNVTASHTTYTFRPCYYLDYSLWSSLALDQFYYLGVATDEGAIQGTDSNYYVRTVESTEQWIRNIPVMYIGNQTLTANPNATSSSSGAVQAWVISENDGDINAVPENGIFAGESNIRTLKVGNNLMGIGNYAFYNCTNLQTITLGNGLTEVGKYAFANCANMSTVGIDFTSRLSFISDYAFQNCRALTSFTLPSSVTAIYDHAFDGCNRLATVDLAGLGQSQNVTLQQLGCYVFRGCTSLTEVVLPESLTDNGKVYLNNFSGCTTLNHILAENCYTTFTPTVDFTVENFKATVPSSFYMEAEAIDSATKDVTVHDFTTKNAIAFKYSGRDCYEIIMIEAASGGGDAKLTYQVNSSNELLYFNMDLPVADVTIPATIGPYGISAISEGSFSDNSTLTKITIPGTVTAIGANAFRGCYNLKHVIFSNAAAIQSIGSNAFATQLTDVPGAILDASPSLSFTGAVGTGIVPFDFAMNPSNRINAGTQAATFITYYSGWPTNLEIQYEEDLVNGTGAPTLVDYPTYSELRTGKYNTGTYPYMTSDYQEAAEAAFSNYEQWLNTPSTELTDYEWAIINAALHVSVPAGVKAITPGLFSNMVATEQEDGTYTVRPVNETAGPDTTVQSLTFADIDEFKPYTINGCIALKQVNITGGTSKIDEYAFAFQYASLNTRAVGDGTGSVSSLETFNMTGGGSTVGDYAFCNNQKLSSVRLSSTVSELGKSPFIECPQLETVDFSGGPYFTTESSIIYGLNNGTKSTLVECLHSRGLLSTPGSVSSTELSGVTEIAQEAFRGCTEVGSVDLSTTTVTNIPEKAFYDTESLYSVTLPTTCRSISKDAFAESNVRYVDIPSSVSLIDPKAFNTSDNPDSTGAYKSIEFYCEAGSAAEVYANEYGNITITDKPVTTTFTVVFWNWDMSVIDTQEVLIGEDAVAPASPTREGYTFTGWLPAFTSISKDTDVVAQYEKIDSEDVKYTVRFIDYDDTVLYTQRISPGEDAIVPQSPTREGYTFTGWRPAITGITQNTDTYAQYEKDTTGSGTGSGSGSGTGSGSGSSSGTGSGSSSDVSGNSTTNSTFYTLTVRNGSGSGSYIAGATVIIVADEPASTQEFNNWTTDSTNVSLASTRVAATTLVMPAANTTVTANFANKTTGSGSTNSTGSSNNTIVSGNNHTTGTVIVIDKNGLSNTGVVSATIKGSSDNFVIRVTENASATESIVKALLEEFGSLDDIKYFPMDISLYDSTGNTRITDTSGLSISITLPLPDSLISYAGNNRVAGVVNDSLDKLSPKFTTIDGVACVTFTAEHFSPYVIYVDTSDLSSTSGVIDDSPKTGDIQPKWFIVTGLTCMAVILFMKRDNTGKKVLVKA